jgi:hypothetical protein
MRKTEIAPQGTCPLGTRGEQAIATHDSIRKLKNKDLGVPFGTKFILHGLSKGSPPYKTSLFKAIESTAQPENQVLFALDLEAIRLLHIDLFIKFAI